MLHEKEEGYHKTVVSFSPSLPLFPSILGIGLLYEPQQQQNLCTGHGLAVAG